MTNKTKVYKLINIRKNPNTGRLTAPVSLTIPTKDVIYKNGKQVPIKFSTGSLQAADNSIIDIKSEIEFKNGYLWVKPHEVDLAKYLDICNWNISNENRIQDKKAIFELVDEGKTKREDMKDLDLRYEAVDIVKEMTTEEMEACAKVLHINADQEAAAIEYDLKLRAETDPSWFLDNSIEDIVLKGKFFKAIDYGIIKFDRHHRSFAWGHIDDGTLIARAPSGIEDMVEWFVSWAEDNQSNGVYNEIIEKVGKAKAPKQTAGA